MNRLDLIKYEIESTKTKINFALKFLREGILLNIENLIDFNGYLKTECKGNDKKRFCIITKEE